MSCGLRCCIFDLVYSLVGWIKDGDRDDKLVCGMWVFASISLNLDLGWDNIFVFPLLDGTDATFQIDYLGNG